MTIVNPLENKNKNKNENENKNKNEKPRKRAEKKKQVGEEVAEDALNREMQERYVVNQTQPIVCSFKIPAT